MKSSRILVRLALVVLLLVTVVLGEEPYLHSESGLKIPASLGSYRRTQIETYPDPSLGTAFSFEGGVAPFVTIYLYSSDFPFSDEVEGLVAGIRLHAEQNGLAVKDLGRRKQTIAGKSGEVLLFQLGEGDRSLFSQAQLFSLGPTLLKLRITGPMAQRRAIESDADRIMMTILTSTNR